MKKITLLFCLLCSITFSGYGQDALTLADNVNVGIQQNTQSIPGELVLTTDSEGSSIVTFTDRVDYLANCSDGTMLTSEDFTGGPTALLACGTSISSAGGVCFPAGAIEEGIEITTSGADIGNTTIFIDPADGFGTLDPAVGSNTFLDFTIINFSTADPVTSVGFDLYSLTGGSSVDIRVIGESGPLGTIVADVTTTGPTFVGLISDDPIVSIELEDLTGVNVELIAQFLFGSCAPPPLNDDPETAASLTVGEVFEDNPVIADNTEATATAIDDPSCGNFTEADLWYSVVVPDSGSVTVESRTDDDSITDTGLSFYEGEVGALVEVVCDDDSGVGLFSLAELEGRTPGEVLFVRVWEWNGGSLGTFQMSAYDTPPPVNDDPEGAIPLMVGSVFTDFPVTASNVSATDTAIDDPSCGNYGGADVWFSVVPPSTGQLVVETDTAGGITDTGMAVYTGEPGALIELTCNDDDGNGLFSLVDLTDQDPSAPLFVRVWEWGGGGFGPFQVAAYSDCPVNAAAIEITGTGETETAICTTDGIPDPIEVTIVGDGVGTNNGWVITDQATGEILELPMAPPFDLDGIEVGVCEIWYIRYEDGLTGLEMGSLIGDLDGCFDFSNPIVVNRVDDGSVCPPSNDDCENGIALECDTTVVGSTVLANDSGLNPSGDVFYTYTGSGSNENITLSLCDGATDYDSLLRVFDDECNLVNEIAVNDDSCGLQSELTFLSDGTTTYTIMVEGFGGNVGNFSMAVTCEMLPDCLQPEDLMVDNITEVSADLSWTDVNNPAAMSYDVEWGVTGFALGTGTVEAGVANPFTLGGLTANTTYDFYVTANCTEDDSSEASGPATFTTTPEMAPPGECEWTLQMLDSFGDGWNGALLNVFRNGQVVLFEVALDDDPANDGSTGVLTFEVLPGDDITTQLVDGGTFPGEISYNIINAGGTTIEGSGDANNDILTGTITATCALSIDENAFEGFTFFPNPAQNTLNISAQTEVQNITLVNLVGQVVLEQQIDATSSQIDISRLTSGVYLMNVSANGQVGTYKVIKE